MLGTHLVGFVVAVVVTLPGLEMRQPMAKQIKIVSHEEDLVSVVVLDQFGPHVCGGSEQNLIVKTGNWVVDDDDRRTPLDLVLSDAHKEVQEGNGGLLTLAEVRRGSTVAFNGVALPLVRRTEPELIPPQESRNIVGQLIRARNRIAVNVLQLAYSFAEAPLLLFQVIADSLLVRMIFLKKLVLIDEVLDVIQLDSARGRARVLVVAVDLLRVDGNDLL